MKWWGEALVDPMVVVWKEKVRENRPKYFVQPAALIESLKESCGLSEGEQIDRATRHIMKIYEEDIPEMFPGADTTLDMLRKSGIQDYIVTHSEADRTGRNMEAHGLDKLVDGVFNIPTNGPKGREQWRGVMEQLGVKPREVLVICDSIHSDVLPNLELGVPAGQIVRINSKYAENLEVPEGVLRAEHVGEVIETIICA